MKMLPVYLIAIILGCLAGFFGGSWLDNSTAKNPVIKNTFQSWALIAEASPGLNNVELWRTFDKETNSYIYYANGGLTILPIKAK